MSPSPSNKFETDRPVSGIDLQQNRSTSTVGDGSYNMRSDTDTDGIEPYASSVGQLSTQFETNNSDRELM